MSSIILGFGKNETDAESKEFDVMRSIVEEAYQASDNELYFSDDFQTAVKEGVAKRFKELKDFDDEISKNHYKDAPERYHYIYPTVLFGTSDVMIGVKFHHINTRHPMSPDGVALLQTKEVFWFDYWDMPKKVEQPVLAGSEPQPTHNTKPERLQKGLSNGRPS